MPRKSKRKVENAPIDCLIQPDRENLLYWAVIEHYRTWLSFDGIELTRLKKTNVGLDKDAVRRIAREYQVNRGITGPKDKKKLVDKAAPWIAKTLNGTRWPTPIQDRAAVCADVAIKADRLNHTKGKAASAMTKLMWFLHPKGWTLFDRFVANAFDIPGTGSVRRMQAFYTELDQRNFVQWATTLNADLGKSKRFGVLFGERVIDKYLMLVGSDQAQINALIATNMAFLQILPPPTGTALKKLALQIANAHAANLLT